MAHQLIQVNTFYHQLNNGKFNWFSFWKHNHVVFGFLETRRRLSFVIENSFCYCFWKLDLGFHFWKLNHGRTSFLETPPWWDKYSRIPDSCSLSRFNIQVSCDFCFVKRLAVLEFLDLTLVPLIICPPWFSDFETRECWICCSSVWGWCAISTFVQLWSRKRWNWGSHYRR